MLVSIMRWTVRIISIILVGIFIFVSHIYADVGPKPSLEIIVKNPPQSEYYLDLLVDYSSDHLYENIRDIEGYSSEMYNMLKAYNVDGWHPALVTGTRVPLSGRLTGERRGSDMVHRFSYVGVPDKFKVIIVTSDSEVLVSENIIERKAFNSTVYFNLGTKKLSEKSAALAYIMQFLSTCSLTLIIEGLILLLFRFSIKQNWRPFLFINIITQVLLTAVIYSATYKLGAFAALFLYMPFELVIFIGEAILFARYLKQHSRLRRVMFAITANILSFMIGLGIMIIYPMM